MPPLPPLLPPRPPGRSDPGAPRLTEGAQVTGGYRRLTDRRFTLVIIGMFFNLVVTLASTILTKGCAWSYSGAVPPSQGAQPFAPSQQP